MIVSIKGHTISDVLPILIKTFIEPVGPVNAHLGDKIQFTSTSGGKWESSDSSLIRIDELNGRAEVVGEGDAEIKNVGLSVKVNTFRFYELEKAKKYSSHTQYAYSPIYPGNVQHEKKVERNIRWSCQVVGYE